MNVSYIVSEVSFKFEYHLIVLNMIEEHHLMSFGSYIGYLLIGFKISKHASKKIDGEFRVHFKIKLFKKYIRYATLF